MSINTSYQLANFNTYPSDLCQSTAKGIANDELSQWHFIWLIPANIASSLAGFILAPISAVCHLIAWAIFRMMECCDNNPVQKALLLTKANIHLASAVESVIDQPIKLCVRLVNMQSENVTNLGVKTFLKLSECQAGNIFANTGCKALSALSKVLPTELNLGHIAKGVGVGGSIIDVVNF